MHVKCQGPSKYFKTQWPIGKGYTLTVKPLMTGGEYSLPTPAMERLWSRHVQSCQTNRNIPPAASLVFCQLLLYNYMFYVIQCSKLVILTNKKCMTSLWLSLHFLMCRIEKKTRCDIKTVAFNFTSNFTESMSHIRLRWSFRALGVRGGGIGLGTNREGIVQEKLPVYRK